MFRPSSKFFPATFTIFIVSISGCQSRLYNSEVESARSSVLVPKRPLGKEADDLLREPNEEANIKTITDINVSMISTNQKRDKTTLPMRSVHTKGHACVRGVFEVDPALPANYSVGVFQPGARYGVWARLSNGAPGVGSDTSPSSRGLAFKLVDVESVLAAFPNVPAGEKLPLLPERPGLGQDFLFLNAPNFLVSNLESYIRVNAAIEHQKALTAFFNADPKDPVFKPQEAVNLAKITLQRISNLLSISWFGQLPYKWRDTAFKYRIDRCDRKDSNPNKRVVARGPNQLGEAVEAVLLDSEVCYSFSVILQYDDAIQPIRDSTVEWLSDDSSIALKRKFANRQEVARLTFPKQDVTESSIAEFCEGVSFNPWNGIAAHEPLGSMGRVRKSSYLASTKTRRANVQPVVLDKTLRQMLSSVNAYGTKR
jgi:hypothetical protein